MQVHWQMTFADSEGKVFTLQIYDATDTGSSASVVTLTAAAHPFTTDEDDDDDLYMPVRTQSGYLRFIAETDAIVSELMPVRATDRPVVLRDADGAAVWAGFLSCEQYSQPWQPLPYEVELPVTGIMGAMDSIDFTQDDGWTSIGTLVDTIAGYLPDGLTAVYPDDIPLSTVCVPNANFQDYLTPAERADSGTTDSCKCDSVREVMEAFCKYFGVSCRERAGSLYFIAHDATGYGKLIPSSHALADLQLRSADNKIQYAATYKNIKGQYSTGRDKADDDVYAAPSDLAATFGVVEALDDLIRYADNEEVQAYVNGTRSTGYNYDRTVRTAYPSFGQVASVRNISATDSNAQVSWSHGFLFRSTKGASQCTAMRSYVPRKLCLSKDDGDTLFSLSASVTETTHRTSDSEETREKKVPALYLKLRVGSHWLSTSPNVAGTEIGVDNVNCRWTDTETICRVPLADGTSIARSRYYNGESLYSQLYHNRYERIEGLCFKLPDDVAGSYADIFIEFMANCYTDDDYKDFGHDYIQYLLSGLTLTESHSTTATKQVTESNDANVYVIKNQAAASSDYQVDCKITTRRGQQYGTGCALSTNDHAYITTQYDLLGLQRRSKLLKRPRALLSITVDRTTLPPIDTIRWQNRPFAILSQSVDWRDGDNLLHLLNIADDGTGNDQPTLPTDDDDYIIAKTYRINSVQVTIGRQRCYWSEDRGDERTITILAKRGLISQGLTIGLLNGIQKWTAQLKGHLTMLETTGTGGVIIEKPESGMLCDLTFQPENSTATVTGRARLTFDGGQSVIQADGYHAPTGIFNFTGTGSLSVKQ